MFRLTREVRFAINRTPDEQLAYRPTNSYGGYPSARGFGAYLTLAVTLAGPLDSDSSYMINIRDVDALVRERGIPLIVEAVSGPTAQPPERVISALFSLLSRAWPHLTLENLALALSPTLAYSVFWKETQMVRLSQKFEFSATHRLHNPALSERQNQEVFGKCNNPHGHGHNYEVQVTLAGIPNSSGVLIDVPKFESIVAETVIDRFDHKNLNIELPEFRQLIPTVENIAQVIYRLLKPSLSQVGATLASVTVWETPKTWCEYSE